MRLRALAKINLGLDVVGKRDDGYHEVRMIMQTIQMYDVLEIEKKKEPGIVLTTNIPYVPTDERNLVYKAAKMLMDEFDIKEGLTISDSCHHTIDIRMNHSRIVQFQVLISSLG